MKDSKEFGSFLGGLSACELLRPPVGVHGCSLAFMGVHGCSWVFMSVR